jgi:hypothetical protein
MTTITPGGGADQPTDSKVRMTEGMQAGRDALQREYAAFVESSFQTLVLISKGRNRG